MNEGSVLEDDARPVIYMRDTWNDILTCVRSCVRTVVRRRSRSLMMLGVTERRKYTRLLGQTNESMSLVESTKRARGWDWKDKRKLNWKRRRYMTRVASWSRHVVHIRDTGRLIRAVGSCSSLTHRLWHSFVYVDGQHVQRVIYVSGRTRPSFKYILSPTGTLTSTQTRYGFPDESITVSCAKLLNVSSVKMMMIRSHRAPCW
jgi:hypothetical protein